MSDINRLEGIVPPSPELTIAVGATPETSGASLQLQPLETEGGELQFAMSAAALRALIDRSEPDALITITPKNMRPVGFASPFAEVPEDAVYAFANNRILVRPATREVHIDRQPELFGPVRFNLLAQLAIRSPEPVHSAKLIETTWPENPELNKTNRQRLRMNISELRQQLSKHDSSLVFAIETISGVGYRALSQID